LRQFKFIFGTKNWRYAIDRFAINALPVSFLYCFIDDIFNNPTAIGQPMCEAGDVLKAEN
jgi:hypothetical protein